ncbi:MAG: alpha/beta hydrolase [Candidatus Lokiarchaeota archaeon]|nr:alpha/beta hydrolase [Candidatus Lokiarchaeota archaeon]
MEWIEDIEEKYIKTNGISLHTIVIGSGEPLVLLHGFPDFWFGWKKLIPLIKDRFQLIIPDMRGYNLSDKPEGVENYHIELLIEDIRGLIDHFGFKSVYLAGHDWGGVLSWFIAEKHPEKIKKLAIINAPHMKIFQDKLKNNEAQKKASSYISRFIQPGSEKVILANNFQVLRPDLIEDGDKYLAAWSQPRAIVSGINYYRANMDHEDWTGVIKIPTLVIHGMKDGAILPVVLDGLENYVEDLKIIRPDELGHSAQKEDPQMVASEFIEFFQ